MSATVTMKDLLNDLATIREDLVRKRQKATVVLMKRAEPSKPPKKEKTDDNR